MVDSNQVNQVAGAEVFTQLMIQGQNDQGQLGIKDSPVVPFLQMISLNLTIKQIACGKAHTHILTSQGLLFSMGSNQFGQLGLGFSQDVLDKVEQPTLVKDAPQFTSIACGDFHSVALDIYQKPFAWGFSDEAAIGTRVTVSNEPTPLQLSKQHRGLQFSQVSCGSSHTCLLSLEGEVLSCGRNNRG